MRTSRSPLVLLGPAGSFSDIASQKLGAGFARHYVASFKDVFAFMKRGAHGLVPVRNKILGPIVPAVQHLKKGKFEILKKVRLPVSFVLAATAKAGSLTKKGTKLENIKTVYCPEVVRQQCSKFIKKNLAHAKFPRASEASTMSFKKIVQLGGNSAATIGPERAAKIYKLKVLARKLEDQRNDWTEFWLILGA